MTRFWFRVALLPALALTCGLLASPARAASLARELQKQAPQIMNYLHEQKYANVGVLKFRVKPKGDSKLSDSVGTLNLTLAYRTQTALLMALDLKKPIGLIDNASAVAAKVPGANHVTQEGRAALFAHRQYPLVWGTDKVAADAFVSGLAVLRADKPIIDVCLFVFDRAGTNKTFPVFSADVDSNLLVEAGKSFLRTRTILPLDGNLVMGSEDTAKTDYVSVEQGKAPPPFKAESGAPVVLEVLYNGQPVPYSLQNGSAAIPEPQPGQQVMFRLRKVDKSPIRYGVVLKVNGESTIFKERFKPEQCKRWILDAETPEIMVKGIQVDDRTVVPFEVHPHEASGDFKIQYGADLGQISMVVFKELGEGALGGPVGGEVPSAVKPQPPGATPIGAAGAPPLAPTGNNFKPPAGVSPVGVPPGAPAVKPTVAVPGKPPGTPDAAPPLDLPRELPPPGQNPGNAAATLPPPAQKPGNAAVTPPPNEPPLIQKPGNATVTLPPDEPAPGQKTGGPASTLPPDEPPSAKDLANLAAIEAGGQSAAPAAPKPEDPLEAQQNARSDGSLRINPRGIIAPAGPGVGREVIVVPFTPDPTPVLVLTITYHRP